MNNWGFILGVALMFLTAARPNRDLLVILAALITLIATIILILHTFIGAHRDA